MNGNGLFTGEVSASGGARIEADSNYMRRKKNGMANDAYEMGEIERWHVVKGNQSKDVHKRKNPP